MPKITLENGTEVDISQESYDKFSKVVSLPKSWEELVTVDGYYTNTVGDINDVHKKLANHAYMNTFATKEQAEASIALAQLSQLMKVYNGGWVPDWKNSQYKYVIHYYYGKITGAYWVSSNAFLSFKTAEIRDEFLENFRDLIETAKPLL